LRCHYINGNDGTRDAQSILWINTMKVPSDFVLKLLTRFPMARWSPIPLRLIVGYGFM
jgi:hypothetical protein